MIAPASNAGQAAYGTRRIAKAIALIGALVGSAYLLSGAVGAPGRPWLGWLALLPLFCAIRLCRPLYAALCGAVLGLSLYSFCTVGAGRAIEPSATSLALLTAIPALYAMLGAALTRWIGFSPLVLGVAWMGVELAFAPLGLGQGLAACPPDQPALLQWVGGALGFVLVAFLFAFLAASFASMSNVLDFSIARRSPRVASGVRAILMTPQDFLGSSRSRLRPFRPRGPPALT